MSRQMTKTLPVLVIVTKWFIWIISFHFHKKPKADTTFSVEETNVCKGSGTHTRSPILTLWESRI